MLTPEQKEKRKGHITASEIGAICGVGRFATREDVMRRKVREHYGLPDEFQGNIATDWGNDHEDEAIAAYEFVSWNTVVRKQEFVSAHIAGVQCGATLDGAIPDAVVEVKCPFGKRNESVVAQEYLEQVPEYMYQVNWQMMVENVDGAVFVVWTTHGVDYYQTCADVRLQSEMLQEAQEFQAELNEIIASEELSAKYLQAKNEYEVREDADFMRVSSEWLLAQSAAKSAQDKADAIKKDLLKLCTANTKGNGLIIYRSERKGSVDYSKVPELQGVNLDQYRKKSTALWTVKESEK